MKKVKFTIEIEDEKLNAINLYGKDSNTDLTSIINKAIQNHYENIVPNEVRFYLESKIKEEKSKTEPSIPKFKK
ncbi:DUF6103 family protein [Erysipelothrix rhusiopathiae]|nr:DUF6103 family protein [Erysipelothrix rhusiopathiae]